MCAAAMHDGWKQVSHRSRRGLVTRSRNARWLEAGEPLRPARSSKIVLLGAAGGGGGANCHGDAQREAQPPQQPLEVDRQPRGRHRRQPPRQRQPQQHLRNNKNALKLDCEWSHGRKPEIRAHKPD
jgi:hypothetical protein